MNSGDIHEPPAAEASARTSWTPAPRHSASASALGHRFVLDEQSAQIQERHFGVSRSQIERDFVISHVLETISDHADLFVFYGGTALSRTILNGLRLSEDIDLLASAPRTKVAPVLDRAIRRGLQRGFGRVTALPA